MATALIFAGCPSQQKWLASKPPLFAKGYHDGCQSAENWWQNNLGHYKVIDNAHRDDPDYKEGWEWGYNRCYSEKETEIQMTRGRF
jgi:hypothetical protein